MVPVHRPKVEFFDVENGTNTDPKGFVREVERYRVEPWGLYMARHSDHHAFHYLESWLIPALGVRVSIFHYKPEHRRDQDYYVDIGEFTTGATVWKAVDHYLDLVVRTGRDIELLDVDELIEARAAGLISTADTHKAIELAVAAVDGIASHGHNLDSWLASHGMHVTWATSIAQPTSGAP
ncbi:DUF402 domain-containing protein [Antrihabitans sp. YC2-6]|uniref:DUF402 domain-containing protein n=1 Tax=Antrihabitans sp. YC2-6 TaxID=2799498 RepID=UPI0027DB0228|nr:DUF402 domain-containing protein [Antrihabitans sp. YC2-6]